MPALAEHTLAARVFRAGKKRRRKLRHKRKNATFTFAGAGFSHARISLSRPWPSSRRSGAIAPVTLTRNVVLTCPVKTPPAREKVKSVPRARGKKVYSLICKHRREMKRAALFYDSGESTVSVIFWRIVYRTRGNVGDKKFYCRFRVYSINFFNVSISALPTFERISASEFESLGCRWRFWNYFFQLLLSKVYY